MNSKLNNAVAIRGSFELSHPDSFLDVEVPYPQALPNDLIVKVNAVSINPADMRARLRKKDDNQLSILGWDVAGTIVEKGTSVSALFQIGDAVYYAGDINRSGGNCSYHAIDSRLVAFHPKTISVEDAAALPLVSLTAWEALFERLALSMDPQVTVQHEKSKSSLLILGGAGGVGSMAIQLAKLVPDLEVIATASRNETIEWCLKLGANHTIDHHKELAPQLSEIGYPEVDYILICNSPDIYFDILPSITRPFGKICSIVPFLKCHDFNLLMRKSLSFHWEFMFTRSSFNTHDMVKQSEILNNISELIDQKKIISPRRTSLFPINASKIRKAHQLIASNQTIGKIVILNKK